MDEGSQENGKFYLIKLMCCESTVSFNATEMFITEYHLNYQ